MRLKDHPTSHENLLRIVITLRFRNESNLDFPNDSPAPWSKSCRVKAVHFGTRFINAVKAYKELRRTLSLTQSLRAVRFLFVGPAVLALLFVINLMSSPGHWWVQWPALGIGIAWMISLFRVLRLLVVVGGLTALIAALRRR